MTFLIGDTLIVEFFSAPAGAGIGVALLGVLSRYSQALARGYLAFRCLEGVAIIAIGAHVLSTEALVPNYEIMIYGFTGVAGLMLSYLLYKANLVPQWLSWLGIVGYVSILLAIPATLMSIATLDAGVGMALYVPGGLFELLLPVILIARGFRRPETPVPPPRGRRLASA